MRYKDVIKSQLRPDLGVIADDANERKLGKFTLFGFQVYVGRQGSGKTMAGVKDVIQIKKAFPNAILVSNCDIKEYHQVLIEDMIEGYKLMPNDYVFFFTPEELEFVLKYVNNGTAGVIYFIDEIHNYFNSLDSKNIPIWVFGEISQQRKQRKLIVATSQLFMRVAKPLREQCDNIISCSNLLTYLMIETIYDGWDISTDSDGNITSAKKGRKYFFQTRELRNKYDTFQKIMKSDYKPFAGSMFDFEEKVSEYDRIAPAQDPKPKTGLKKLLTSKLSGKP